MESFNYAAINEHGRTIRGRVSADNELDLEARLKQAGLDLVSARKVKEKKATFLSRVKTRDLIVFCLHLEQLDRAGVPLHEALSDIRDTAESAKLKDILTNVYESVKNGSMLSAAMAEHPKVFNDVFTGLVAAGEKTGKLSEAFGHLAHHLKWVSEIRRKVKKAVRYPAVLVVVITIVISVMMLYVVPKLTTFILSQGFTIPFHTRALIAVSHAFQEYWYLMFGIPTMLAFLLVFAYRRSAEFAYRVDNIMLRVPVLGPVIRKIDMARFTHFFSVMFNSGIDVLESLRTAGGVVKNRVLKESVEAVRNSVTEGNSLTSSLRISSHFPNLVIRMFKVGEDSGNMREALENVNFFYDREVGDSVDNLVGMIQPTLTVVMGMVIFWVISAIFGPLYESFSKMKF